MAVATYTRTDEEIQKDVLAELKWDAQIQPNEIGVSVKDGIVTLTGWVDSYLKKWSAEEAAHKVTGVKAVANARHRASLYAEGAEMKLGALQTIMAGGEEPVFRAAAKGVQTTAAASPTRPR